MAIIICINLISDAEYHWQRVTLEAASVEKERGGGGGRKQDKKIKRVKAGERGRKGERGDMGE